MANRVTVSICGEEYTFVAEEAPSYMQKVGAYVDEKMCELLSSAKVGRTDAAVLTAANVADELFKEREAGESLRRQLKQYLDEAGRTKNESSELKRELFKERETSEGLRRQIKQQLEDGKSTKSETSELKRELTRAQEACESLRAQLKAQQDAAERARVETAELKRRIFELQQRR